VLQLCERKKIRVGSDPLRLATEATVSVIFLQFLCRQVDKLDLEKSFEMLNAILQFDSRFFICQVSWSVEKNEV